MGRLTCCGRARCGCPRGAGGWLTAPRPSPVLSKTQSRLEKKGSQPEKGGWAWARRAAGLGIVWHAISGLHAPIPRLFARACSTAGSRITSAPDAEPRHELCVMLGGSQQPRKGGDAAAADRFCRHSGRSIRLGGSIRYRVATQYAVITCRLGPSHSWAIVAARSPKTATRHSPPAGAAPAS